MKDQEKNCCNYPCRSFQTSPLGASRHQMVRDGEWPVPSSSDYDDDNDDDDWEEGFSREPKCRV